MLEDVLVKIEDLWVHEDFIIANVIGTNNAQIILGSWLLQIARFTYKEDG